jgi:hypothetical protein
MAKAEYQTISLMNCKVIAGEDVVLLEVNSLFLQPVLNLKL